MIEVNDAIFPNNVVLLLNDTYKALDPDFAVFRRPLRHTDPRQSIGIVAQLWNPDDESIEMRGQVSPGPTEPTLSNYLIGIQAFVKEGDEEKGLALHATMSHLVRGVLYRNAPLRVALAGLTATDPTGGIERLKQWKVNTQRYFSNEIDSDWLYLSTLELWIETERI